MKNLLIVLIFFVFKGLLAHADEKTKYSKNSLDKEVYYKIGIFDYKHPTDMLAVNRKVVHNKQTDLPYIGAVNKIYDLMIMGDKNNFYSYKDNGDDRDEYAIYISTGYQTTFDLPNNINVSPSFSVGLYGEMDQGKNMGFPLNFKSELEFNYLSKNDFIYGFTYNHISNADIGYKNPGSDSFLFSVRKQK